MEEYCKYKLFYEIIKNNFQFSVFGYGFRKSEIITENTFDEAYLCILDAENYNSINPEEEKKAFELFGHTKMDKITEFP